MAKAPPFDLDYIPTGEPLLRTVGIRWPSADLCVHFVNTAEPREEPSKVNRRTHLGLVVEPLVGYDAMVRWMGRMKQLTGAEVEQLLALSDQFPPPAIEMSTELSKLRTMFERMVNTLADRKWPAREDCVVVRDLVNRYWQPLSFELEERGGRWVPAPAELSLELPHRQLVFSMARLLTTRLAHRVRRCADKECTLLFINSVIGTGRSWCDKRVCGERNRKRPSRAIRW